MFLYIGTYWFIVKKMIIFILNGFKWGFIRFFYVGLTRKKYVGYMLILLF